MLSSAHWLSLLSPALAKFWLPQTWPSTPDQLKYPRATHLSLGVPNLLGGVNLIGTHILSVIRRQGHAVETWHPGFV